VRQTLSSLALMLLLTQNLSAEPSMSKIEHVTTNDCHLDSIKEAIYSSSNRIMYSEKNLTLLEEALEISENAKKSGTTAKLVTISEDFDTQNYKDEVSEALKTVEQAEFGKVITLNPRGYRLAYAVKNARQEELKQGVIQTQITCRLEKKDKNTPITTTARLISYQVDPKD
jgi:hypothetical protein